MKKDSIETDSTSSTQLRRKKQWESEHVHCEECTEIEDIHTTA